MIPPGSYEAAKRIARTGTEAERVALAGQASLAPELLYYLASDHATAVRSAVAANAATPVQADRLLSADADPEVRAATARKLAPAAPRLAEATDRRSAQAWAILQDLAADAAVRVRAVIAEEVKALPDAPRALILRLAHDAAAEVAEPVIRFSPLLTEDDLLALVAAPPTPAAVTAVASRALLSERVTDAIAAGTDPTPIATLLGNPGAQLREAALDGLIARAADRPDWQERIVRRPSLPPRAAQALAQIVADHLLGPLAARTDLDPGLAQALRDRVARRLDLAPVIEEPLADRFLAAGRRGDQATMRRLLSEASGLPIEAVERAVWLRSAKAIVSLCWKAGFPPTCLDVAQAVLGRFGPQTGLRPGPDGGWPLSAREMQRQVDALAEEATARG